MICGYDTIRWTILTCAQMLTSSQLNMPHGTKQKRTRMLAINVSIPNLTVARVEQFPSPQMTDNKPSFTRKPHVVIFRHSPFVANAVPKLVAMATSLRPSISGLGYVFIG